MAGTRQRARQQPRRQLDEPSSSSSTASDEPSSTSGSELEGDRPQTEPGYKDAGQQQADETNEG